MSSHDSVTSVSEEGKPETLSEAAKVAEASICLVMMSKIDNIGNPVATLCGGKAEKIGRMWNIFGQCWLEHQR